MLNGERLEENVHMTQINQRSSQHLEQLVGPWTQDPGFTKINMLLKRTCKPVFTVFSDSAVLDHKMEIKKITPTQPVRLVLFRQPVSAS